jgi:hypothetical protein
MLTLVSSRRLQEAQNTSTTPSQTSIQTQTQTQTQSQTSTQTQSRTSIQTQSQTGLISASPSAFYSITAIHTPQAEPSTSSASWTQSPTMSQTESQTQRQSLATQIATTTASATARMSFTPPQPESTSIFTKYYTEIIVGSTVLGSLITFAIISNIWDCIKRKQKKAQDKKKALTEVIPNPSYNQNIRHSSVANIINSF